MPADDGLLGVAAAAIRHAPALGDVAVHDALGDLDRPFVRGLRLVELVVAADVVAGREWLRKLRTVTVERNRLDHLFPRVAVRFFDVRDRRVLRHIDRLAQCAADEWLRRRHHVDVGQWADVPRTVLAARGGAVEHRQVLVLEERRAFERHPPADHIGSFLDLRLRKAQRVVQNGVVPVRELRIGHAELLAAELIAQHVLVEDEAYLEGAQQLRFDLGDRLVVEALRLERGLVDVRRAFERVCPFGEDLDRRDLLVVIAQTPQRRLDRLVDDLEVTTTCELLELHQRKVRLDPGGVAIHHEANGAGRSDARDLCVAVARDLADRERVVPRRTRQRPGLLGEERRLMGDRCNRELLVLVVRNGIRCAPVVAQDAAHVLCVAIVAEERSEFARHLGRSLVRSAGHQCRDRRAPAEAFLRVIRQAEAHEESAHVSVAEAEGPIHVRPSRNLSARELCHQHADLEGKGPDSAGIGKPFRLEMPALVQKSREVQRCEIACRVIQKRVLATGITCVDSPISGTRVPFVERRVVLDARIGALPRCEADLLPKICSGNGLVDSAVGTPDQIPRLACVEACEKLVGDAHRVVRVLARDGPVRLGIPIRVVRLDGQLFVALFRVVESVLDVRRRNAGAECRPHRGLQAVVERRIEARRLRDLRIVGGSHDGVEVLFADDRTGD